MAAAITDTENQVNLPCWDSAEVDPEANFEGVTSVFGYGSLVRSLLLTTRVEHMA
eukprot:m.57190 g.57190  ORF g.57190 m.57190 type:complete len:55 (+) comp9339_c0_seq1:173-337(+)